MRTIKIVFRVNRAEDISYRIGSCSEGKKFHRLKSEYVLFLEFN